MKNLNLKSIQEITNRTLMCTEERAWPTVSIIGLIDSRLLLGDMMAELPIDEFPGAAGCWYGTIYNFNIYFLINLLVLPFQANTTTCPNCPNTIYVSRHSPRYFRSPVPPKRAVNCDDGHRRCYSYWPRCRLRSSNGRLDERHLEWQRNRHCSRPLCHWAVCPSLYVVCESLVSV